MGICRISPNESSFTPNMTAWKALSADELMLFKMLINQMTEDSIGDENSIFAWPCIKSHFRTAWIPFALLYAVVGLAGVIGNLYVIYSLCSESVFKRLMHFLLLNLFVSDLIKGLVLLPFSLSALLLKHWWFGAAACSLFPMIQHFPLLLSVISYMLTALNRYMDVFHPSKRVQGHLFYLIVIVIVWVFCGCLVWPFRSYMSYIDLEIYLGPVMRGQGLCAVGFSSDIREYNSCLFVAFYAIPIILTFYMYAKMHNELKYRMSNEGPFNESSIEDHHLSADADSELLRDNKQSDSERYHRTHSHSDSSQKNSERRATSLLEYIDQERNQIDLFMKSNRCLIIMLVLFTLAWFPLQCLMLVTYVIPERAEAAAAVDTFFVTFLLIGLLSTVSNPLLLLHQRKRLGHAFTSSIRSVRRRLSSLSAPKNISRSSALNTQRSYEAEAKHSSAEPPLTHSTRNNHHQHSHNYGKLSTVEEIRPRSGSHLSNQQKPCSRDKDTGYLSS